MPYKRGDIIWVYFSLPYERGYTKEHPAVIISNDQVYDHDDMYIIVMITTSPRTDRYSFHLKDNMLTGKMPKENSQARTHLISYLTEQQIVTDRKVISSLKKDYVDRLVERINITSIIADEDL